MPCSPRSVFTNNITSMASSKSKIDIDYLDIKKVNHSDISPANSDTETVNVEEEDDDESPSKTKFTRGKRHSTKKKTTVRKRRVSANIAATKYDVVRRTCAEAGMAITRDADDNNCFFYWSDSAVPSDRITELKPYQRINHFPGMGEICKKDSLARNIAKMQRAHPDEYSFTPQTWVIPAEYASFQCYCRDLKKKRKVKTFIMKPASGAMGNGISLIRNGDRVPSHEQIVIQEYIDRPFLLDGFKFDLRIYVLVVSCDPLKIFVYDDGLVRLGTEPYEAPSDDNMDELFMHLTNYSINKHNENFDKDDSTNNGSKRTIKYLKEWLQSMDYDVNAIWRSITDVIVKTLIVAQPHLLHSYRMARPGSLPGSDSVCFELLGFDVILDKKLRPWVLEVNRSPSFGTDAKLDAEIKGGALRDTLRLLNIKASDRRRGIAAEKAESQKRLLTQPKRSEYGMSELEKKRIVLNKRRLELKHRLNRIRQEAAREEYENMNMGNFKRVFPPDERSKLEKYNGLLADAFKLFLSGRASTLQREVNQPFSTLREEEILDLLEQCEADETLTHLESKDAQNGYRPLSKGPKPLSSMPSSKFQKEEASNTSSSSLVSQRQSSDLGSSFSRSTQRIVTSLSSPPMKFNPVVDAAYLNAAVREREEELCRRTLQAFEDMRIKFPGKTDEEAEIILENIQENWKFHKPRVASYWLVKLDSIKRRKVIDIVRTNTRAILQRIWRSSDVDNLRLCRIFSRVFNRLLWSHGQGLWNCFSSIGNSWETIFSKSTEVLSSTEMSCCRRIVELCRDCLLIVYQFASDAKAASTSTKPDDTTSRDSLRRVPDLTSQHVLSSRLARLSKGNQVPSL